MKYPGHVIKEGESNTTIVESIQAELNAHGCGPLEGLGVFGPKTKASVKLFQARNVDSEGDPLKQDGKVGPLTWGALFGHETIPVATNPASPYLFAVLETAASQVGVREDPRNSN